MRSAARALRWPRHLSRSPDDRSARPFLAAIVAVGAPLLEAQPAVIAVTGATLIDGNGGESLADAIVIVADGRIRSAGPRVSVEVPSGARILAAGNIIGWGGPYSVSFSLIRELGLTLFQEQVNDEVSQGVGEDLVDLTPEELVPAIGDYLDKGPDFLKDGATAHFARPSFIGFSPEAQKVIVDAAHARGKVAETHAAGVDVDGKIVCSMLVSTITGEAWTTHLQGGRGGVDEARRGREEEARRGRGDVGRHVRTSARPQTAAELRQRQAEEGLELEMRRANARALIKAGVVVTVGTDSYWAAAPEFSRRPKSRAQDHGIGTVLAIEGLVELGMTPAQAIVAGTRNGAIASRGLAQYGTVEAGKRADLLVLDASPLDDIRNLRKVSVVMKDGAVIDRDALPSVRVLSRAGQ